MAFSTYNVGESNAGVTDNFAKVYEARVVEAWRNQPALAAMQTPLIHRKTMTSLGFSYQIPQFADLPDVIQSYIPGTDLLGQSYAFDNISITRDNYIVEAQFVKRDDMKTSHYEVFSRLARSQTRKVKMELDRRLFITGALAARAAAKTHTVTALNVHQGGTQVFQVAATVAAAFPRNATGAANYRERLRELRTAMSRKAIPIENRIIFHTPYMDDVLSFDTTNQVFSTDFVEMRIGNNIMKYSVRQVDGFKIMPFVNNTTDGGSLPDQNFTTGPTKYQANFTVQAASVGTPVALCLTEGPDGDAAVSMGEWEGLYAFVEYIPQVMGWLVGTAYLAGIGQMSPSCAGAVCVASS